MLPVQATLDTVIQQITTVQPKQHLANDQFLLHWVKYKPQRMEDKFIFSGLCKSLDGETGKGCEISLKKNQYLY